jgi:hypothetical protein
LSSNVGYAETARAVVNEEAWTCGNNRNRAVRRGARGGLAR